MLMEAQRLGISKSKLEPKKSTFCPPHTFSPKTSIVALDYELYDMLKGSIVSFVVAEDTSLSPNLKETMQNVIKLIHHRVSKDQQSIWHEGFEEWHYPSFGECEAYVDNDENHRYWNPKFVPPHLLVLEKISPKVIADHIHFFSRLMKCGDRRMADWLILPILTEKRSVRVTYSSDYVFEFKELSDQLVHVKCFKNRRWGTRLNDGFTLKTNHNVPVQEILPKGGMQIPATSEDENHLADWQNKMTGIFGYGKMRDIFVNRG